MTEKTSRSRKTSQAPKAPKARKSIASAASTSSRVASKDAAKAAIEAAAAAVAPRAPKAPEVTSVAPVAIAKAVSEPRMEAALQPVGALLQTGSEQARETFAKVKATTESLRQAVSESAAASSRGVIEVNDKLIEAMRAQSDAAFDLWRSALSATSVSEAIRIQTGGARQVYETATSQWKDIAETTGRWFAASVKPMQSVFETDRR